MLRCKPVTALLGFSGKTKSNADERERTERVIEKIENGKEAEDLGWKKLKVKGEIKVDFKNR